MVISYFGRAIAWNRDLVYEDRTDASQDQLDPPNDHDIQRPGIYRQSNQKQRQSNYGALSEIIPEGQLDQICRHFGNQ